MSLAGQAIRLMKTTTGYGNKQNCSMPSKFVSGLLGTTPLFTRQRLLIDRGIHFKKTKIFSLVSFTSKIAYIRGAVGPALIS